MTQKLTNLQIIRALETPLGLNYGAYADDPVVEAARVEIQKRYQELYRLDFDLASLSARLEWLQKHRPETMLPATHIADPHRPEESLCGPVVFQAGPLVQVLEILSHDANPKWCSICTKSATQAYVTAMRAKGEKVSNEKLREVVGEIYTKLVDYDLIKERLLYVAALGKLESEEFRRYLEQNKVCLAWDELFTVASKMEVKDWRVWAKLAGVAETMGMDEKGLRVDEIARRLKNKENEN